MKNQSELEWELLGMAAAIDIMRGTLPSAPLVQPQSQRKTASKDRSKVKAARKQARQNRKKR